jgi:hypothetical protein
MTGLRTRLSSGGFANVPFDEIADDFEFIVGNSHFPCSRLQAAFLSPKIATRRTVDPTIASYSVSTIDNAEIFSQFLSIFSGAELFVRPTNRSDFMSLARELGNVELLTLIRNHFGGNDEALSTENAVSCYLAKKAFNEDVRPEIEFLASHFSVISVKKLNLADLDEILAHASLRIVSEDWLLDFILSNNFLSLVEHVRFELLTVDGISRFVDRIYDIELNAVIINRLCSRLVLPVKAPVDKSRQARRATLDRQFAPQSSGSLDGIIAYLTDQCGGNVHDRDVVLVKSSMSLTANAAKNIADLAENSCFSSMSRGREDDILHTRNNWICYDFKDRRVIVTHYTLRSNHTGGVNDANLKSWAIDVSVDGNIWIQIDHKQSNNELNAKNVARTFEVAKRGEIARFVRLVNIGRNHYGNDRLVLSAFELFGTLKG